MVSASMAALSLRGTKRKAPKGGDKVEKKTRRSPTPCSEDGIDSPDGSNYDSQEEDSDFQMHTLQETTPITPISSKASPRFPSQLKNFHCCYEGCTKSYNRPTRLAEHVRSHTNTRCFVCPHYPCTKDFLRESHLKHHIKSAHTDIRDYVCQHEACGKQFLTGTRLKRHQLVHEGMEKYRCNVDGCGQSFRKHGTLQKHTMSTHEGKKPFVCDEIGGDGKICGAGFDTAPPLKSHYGRMHGGNKYWCTLCNLDDNLRVPPTDQDSMLAFSTYAEFQAHNKAVHPPSCDQCGHQCRTAKELTRHYEIQHGTQRLPDRQTNICPEVDCGRGFTTRGNLTIHLKTVHAGERAFICGGIELSSLNKVVGWDGSDSCGKKYLSKANLEEHIRTAHLGIENSRKSKRQGQSAGRQRKAKISMSALLTGTGYHEDADRVISCLQPGCAYMFTRDYDLEIHLQSRHGLADIEIQVLRATLDAEECAERGYRTTAARSRNPPNLEADAEFGSTRVEQELEDDNQDDWTQDIETAVTQGGEFWLGGRIEDETGQDNWDNDEMEMRKLIGDGSLMEEDDDGHDEMFIDPALL